MDKITLHKELQRITEDLKNLQQIVSEDCSQDKDRYHVGVLVGIGYAQRELERLVHQQLESENELADR